MTGRLGERVALSLPRPVPPHTPLEGAHVRLVPMVADHADGFFEAFTDPDGWLYLGDDEPFTDRAAARRWTTDRSASRDPLFYTILVAGVPQGFCSFLRITPAHGVIEIGYIHYAPALKGTVAATETQYLMMRHAFEDLGYRRYEWKCNALNMPSRRAAERLGFVYEGTFRQAQVNKGRNRDTAWYAVIDRDWPQVRKAFEAWLSPSNFDAAGDQRTPLSLFRA